MWKYRETENSINSKWLEEKFTMLLIWIRAFVYVKWKFLVHLNYFLVELIELDGFVVIGSQRESKGKKISFDLLPFWLKSTRQHLKHVWNVNVEMRFMFWEIS